MNSKAKSATLASGIAIVAGILLVVMEKEPKGAAKPAQEPLSPVAKALIQMESPRSHSEPAAPAPVSRQDDSVYDFERERSDPEYAKKAEKSRELQYLEASPAKDTPEARLIQALLAQRNIGREAVPECYNVAYAHAQAMRQFEKAGANPNDAYALATLEVRPKFNRLAQRYNLGDDFFQTLFSIKPMVFFGQRDLDAPEDGTKLLTE